MTQKLQDYIARALYAAWRLLSLDKSGLAFIEVNGRNVLRSFLALLFALPLYLLSLFLVTNSPGSGVIARSPLYLLVAGYALGWPIFAFLAFQFARLVGAEPHYMRFIIAYNWARIFAVILALPANALILFGLVSRPAGDILLLVTFLIIALYQWYVIKAAFATSPFHSLLILALDMAILFAIESIIISWFLPIQ